MKTVSDVLFRLVKSLTSLEKGYFKKFAAKNTGGKKNNYILLFDAIDRMDKYDEDLLCKRLKNATFIKQLPVYKNYLYNLILRSLNSYSTYETSDSKINELIENALVLSKKALNDEALKNLKKAKAQAVKFENTKALLEILSIERSIIMTMPDKHTLENRSKIYEEQLELLKTLEMHTKLSWLCDNMVVHVEVKGDFRTEQKEKEIRKIMSDPLLKKLDRMNDLRSKQFWFRIHVLEQLAEENPQKVYYYFKKEIELTQEFKYLIPTFVRTYIQSLVNYLLFANLVKDRQGEKDAFRRIYELRKMIKNKMPLDVEIMILSNTCYAEVLIFMNNCDLIKGRSAAKRTERLLKDYSSEIPIALRVVLLFNTARFWFIDGNFENALRMINILINETPTSFKRDLYDFSRLFQLLIHFELGNLDVLENSIEATYRFMKERDSVFEVEAALFKFFRNILRTYEKTYRKEYEELLHDLENSIEKSQSKITLGIFDFITWVKSKIAHKQMVQLIMEKMENISPQNDRVV